MNCDETTAASVTGLVYIIFISSGSGSILIYSSSVCCWVYQVAWNEKPQ